LDTNVTAISGASQRQVIDEAAGRLIDQARDEPPGGYPGSCCDALMRQTGVVNRIGRLAVSQLVRPAGIKEIQSLSMMKTVPAAHRRISRVG